MSSEGWWQWMTLLARNQTNNTMGGPIIAAAQSKIHEIIVNNEIIFIYLFVYLSTRVRFEYVIKNYVRRVKLGTT